MLEMDAILITAWKLAEAFNNKTIILFVDSNVVLGSIIRGSSHLKRLNWKIMSLWSLVALNKISLWLERVSSKSNPADIPSRGREPMAPHDHSMTRFPIERGFIKTIKDLDGLEKVSRSTIDELRGSDVPIRE